MKIRIIALALAFSMVFCAGCSQQNEQQGKGGFAAASRDGQGAGSAGRTQTGAAVVSESVKANAVRTITGTVESIVGNEVTLLISTEGKGGEAALPKGKDVEPQDTDGKAQPDKNTATFLLPVGMRIGSKDFSTITAGSSIRIYFGVHPDDQSEIITAVEVMGGRR